MPAERACSVCGTVADARWVDYCAIGYFVKSPSAMANMSAVVDRLRAVGEGEARAKHAALRRVRDAFVFRRGSSVEAPSAPEYILSEACAAGQQWRTSGSTAPT